MRIAIVGQYGFGNVGDEGILQAIMDELGMENEYVVCTPLPFTMLDDYRRKIPNVAEVRSIEDTRMDFDACIYGGGKVDWGFAWGFFIRAFAKWIPTMAYGIGLRTDEKIGQRLEPLFYHFFNLFQKISVRDINSQQILAALGINSKLSDCPAMRLREEKASADGSIVVCPRYGDFDESGKVDNEPQIDWFVERLKNARAPTSSILLIPFFPKDLEGHYRDLELCIEINRRLGGGCHFFPCDGFNARKVKYAISRSEFVISGGRYHAIVWAMAHDIPYEIAPTVQGIALAKLEGLISMATADNVKLFKAENKALFEAMFP